MRFHSRFRSIVPQAVAIILLTFTAFYSQAQSSVRRIPAGTTFTVRNNSEISSGNARTGQSWSGTLVGDLSVRGSVVARNGARVRGKVAEADSSGRMKNSGVLALEVTSVNGIPVTTDFYALDGEGHTKSNVTKIGGGAALGALLGGVFGGGKGAAIGAAAGAGAGTATAAATGKKEAVIPRESTLTFTAH